MFVITHGWFPKNYFHQLIQMLPRLALYVPFLQMNPHIYIHVYKINIITQQVISSLGLNNPLISGNIKADMVYSPQGSGCDLNPFSVQFMSELLHSHIRSKLLKPTHKIHGRTVLFIERKKRKLKQQAEILHKLQSLCDRHDYSLVIFQDDPSPSIAETMEMFHQAALVVGSHGAGLANLLFSNPGVWQLYTFYELISTFY